MLHAPPVRHRRRLWNVVLLFVALAACPALAAAATPVRLAEGQVARFDIVVADETDEHVPPAPAKPLAIEFGNPRTSVWESAHLLADYLEASTGAAFTVRKASDTPTRPGALHVGATRYAAARFANDPQAADLDEDGFIHEIGEQHIFILGGSDLGTEFGVYDFLERHVGVRWLFPGELGEHVPTHPTLDVPAGFFRDEPRILSRSMRPHRVEGGMTWAQRLRAHLRVEFHHNIPKLFPARFTREHPELYPIIDGQRYLPPQVNIPTWHPCYSAPTAVSATVELLNDFFAKYPQYDSVSLGISDANEERNCHCPDCVKQYPDRLNTLGFADRSDIYYDWCNKVIAGVRQTYPDKTFGCIAYRGVTDPPQNTAVSEHLVPFLCFDRMLWVDPARAAQDRKMTEAWAAAASQLGWYDYLYGEAYAVPRIYSHTLQRALQFAYEHKVRHYYAEANPSADWHEGPKFYIAMRLLWNPDADVDALLRDWCEAAVGKEAAPDLVRYFEFWEDFWTQRVPQTAWFSDRSKIYLIFNTRGYLDALTMDDLEQCSTWLASVEARAAAGKQKQRAVQLREGFERRRQETLDYFMVNNQIPSDPQRTRDVRTLTSWDFDAKPSGWEPYSSENRGTWHWAEHAGREGTGALRIDNATSVIRRGVDVRPSGKYRISGWYKMEGALPDAARLEMKLEWRDQDRDEFRGQQLSLLLPVERGGGWQPFTMVCTPPRVPGRAGHSVGIAFSFHYAPESSVLIDDLTVTQIVVKR